MDEQLSTGWGSQRASAKDGVFRRGFGIVPKFVMLDPELPITSKTIYAFLCACAGDQDSAWPGRDTIVSRLGCTKDTYYKYLSILKESGYITIEQTMPNSRDRGFCHNVYHLVSNPPRYAEFLRKEPPAQRDTLAMKGIRGAGYGILPRVVMEDPAITCKAKALYALLASFTGGGKCAFPRVENLLYYLGISQSTYLKLIRELRTRNLVVVTQRKEQGRLGVNEYELVDHPDPSSVEKDSRKKKIRKQPVQEPAAKAPCADFSDAWKPAPSFSPLPQEDENDPYGYLPLMEDPDEAFPHTTTNSPTTNSFTMISPSYHQNPLSDRIDGMNEREVTDLVKERMGYQILKDRDDPNLFYYDNLVSIVSDTLTLRSDYIRIAGSRRRREDVVARLLSLGYEEYRHVLDKVTDTDGQIRNLRAYYLTCLYNASADISLEVRREVERACF